jgi:UDP-2-acetamido-3-amino-2,3-dideoxy-glucuronate N-acetyltransferase
MMIHPLADVKSTQIGPNTRVWQFSVIMEDVVIGENCNINCHTFIESGVRLGNNVTVKSGVYLWTGLRVADNVFIGPNVTFTNDKYPRSKQYPEEFQNTILHRNSSLGAGAIILGGTVIGEYALVAAGSVVTKNVPARAMVMGNPARIVGWVNQTGSKMKQVGDKYLDEENREWTIVNNELILI